MRSVFLLALLLLLVLIAAHGQSTQGSNLDVLLRDQTRDEINSAKNAQRIDELERRVLVIEDQKVSERVAKLETDQESNRTMLYGVAVGIAMLLIEAILRMIGAAKKQGTGGQRI